MHATEPGLGSVTQFSFPQVQNKCQMSSEAEAYLSFLLVVAALFT